jgi:hypothetical protein
MPSSEQGKRVSTAALILAPLVLVLVTLLLAEILLRTWFNLFPPMNYNLLPPDKAGLHLFEPAIGNAFYAVKPNYRQEFLRNEFRGEVSTNNIGLRETEDVHGEAVDIAFIGDSYTFGWGVEAGERYSDRVREAYPELNVLSYSYPNGHAPANYLAWLQARPELMPRILVLGLFAFNDLAGDTADAVVVEQNGRIVSVGSRSLKVDADGFIVDKAYTPPSVFSWPWFKRHTAIGRAVNVATHSLKAGGKAPAKPGEFKAIDRGEWDETALEALDHVRRIDALARAQGSTLLVFYIPFPSYISESPVCIYTAKLCAQQARTNPLGEALADWAAGEGMHYIDPVEYFRRLSARGEELYYPYDGHWTPAGHAAAGRLIVDYLDESALLEQASPGALTRQ